MTDDSCRVLINGKTRKIEGCVRGDFIDGDMIR